MEKTLTSSRGRIGHQVLRDDHCGHDSRNISGEDGGQGSAGKNRLCRSSASLRPQEYQAAGVWINGSAS
jgi:hypothetical protein